MMKYNHFDKNWKDFYCHCLRKLTDNFFVATIALNTNFYHLDIIKLKLSFEGKKTLIIEFNNG